ncbi:WD40 repeat-like protein, partial [Fistulina hepatica ATCC 64428]
VDVTPAHPTLKRSASPSSLRRLARKARRGIPLFIPRERPRTYTVEAVCALPHPEPIHALAASSCMTHLLTGADDGYIRDYDLYTSVNGKIFLSSQQRHHASVVEGLIKAGQLRCWWENPPPTDLSNTAASSVEGRQPSSVLSLAMHSEALWALSGSSKGHINLFTVRHEPGRLVHTLNGHNLPVSALALDHDEKGLFSASWDGVTIQWDLNTGQQVRQFTSHGAQLSCVAVRPVNAVYRETGTDSISLGLDMPSTQAINKSPQAQAQGIKSDADMLSLPTLGGPRPPPPKPIGLPKTAPPVLTSSSYRDFSPDILMTAGIDGQIILWDKRVPNPGRDTTTDQWKGVGRLWLSEKTPPWCMSATWSPDGMQIYAGRRNGAVEVWDVRQMGLRSNTPRLLKTLRNPASSGVVSCVVAFPDSRHIACASIDNIRLWNVAEAGEFDATKSRGGVQFKIIPGHHGGYVSQMLIDPAGRFMVTASSNRGWHGESTRTVFIHDIKRVLS